MFIQKLPSQICHVSDSVDAAIRHDRDVPNEAQSENGTRTWTKRSASGQPDSEQGRYSGVESTSGDQRRPP